MDNSKHGIPPFQAVYKTSKPLYLPRLFCILKLIMTYFVTLPYLRSISICFYILTKCKMPLLTRNPVILELHSILSLYLRIFYSGISANSLCILCNFKYHLTITQYAYLNECLSTFTIKAYKRCLYSGDISVNPCIYRFYSCSWICTCLSLFTAFFLIEGILFVPFFRILIYFPFLTLSCPLYFLFSLP